MTNEQPSAAHGWQPIGTAPLDGSYVDLWCSPYNGQQRRVSDAWWTDRTGWRTGTEIPVKMRPTHWRLVPPSPQSEQRAPTTSEAAIRDNALEDAARVCEGIDDGRWRLPVSLGIQKCVAAIRQMKGSGV